MDTSLMVYDYPDPPEPKTKTISGKMYVVYKFEMEVPEDWDLADIKEDMYDNIREYEQDLDEIIDIDI